jgi:hypothetical protein
MKFLSSKCHDMLALRIRLVYNKKTKKNHESATILSNNHLKSNLESNLKNIIINTNESKPTLPLGRKASSRAFRRHRFGTE